MINNIKDNIINVFSSYLDAKGYNFNESQVIELVEIYLDCQEWDDDKILTGLSILEMQLFHLMIYGKSMNVLLNQGQP